jgi:hypothetical protein
MQETPSSNEDYEQVDLLLRGFQLSRMLRLVADLEIADKIASDGGMPLDPLPPDASPAAQADAYACLLDARRIERAAVIGASAGAPSAMP